MEKNGCAVREARLKTEINRWVEELINNYQPEKIIIFGSVASGNITDDSDVDMVIVKKTNKRFLDRIGDVMKLLQPNIGLDVLVYTPEEYDRLVKTRWFFHDEIESKGMSVYERRDK